MIPRCLDDGTQQPPSLLDEHSSRRANTMHEAIQIDYQGAQLTLTFSTLAAAANAHSKFNRQPSAELRINGLLRDSAGSSQDPITLSLSSTVQTDYEWHEYIEAIIEYQPETITARLLASSIELTSLTLPRTI
jgi:hypothetical protein